MANTVFQLLFDFDSLLIFWKSFKDWIFLQAVFAPIAQLNLILERYLTTKILKISNRTMSTWWFIIRDHHLILARVILIKESNSQILNFS